VADSQCLMKPVEQPGRTSSQISGHRSTPTAVDRPQAYSGRADEILLLGPDAPQPHLRQTLRPQTLQCRHTSPHPANPTTPGRHRPRLHRSLSRLTIRSVPGRSALSAGQSKTC
jgi:hypothetical protein